MRTRVVIALPAAKLVAALACIMFAAPLAAQSQSGAKVPRVGILTVAPLSSSFTRQFPEALRDRGYVEGQNIILEWRAADGKLDRLPGLAAELVRVKTDIIVALTNADIVAAKRATATIPIIMVSAVDPVGNGLVASLARPGGNVTGRMYSTPETLGKQLEILKETVPTTTRVVYLHGAGVPGYATIFQGMRAGAQALGLTLRAVEVQPASDVARALEEIGRWKADALYVGTVGVSTTQRDTILKYAVQHRLPAIYAVRTAVDAGGLMAYVPSSLENIQRTTAYVDRILKGARPADLPVEQPQKFDLAVNLKTARAMGLTIPQSILLRADTLIE